jgi:tetratricopeptide (TPR) repeat protein
MGAVHEGGAEPRDKIEAVSRTSTEWIARVLVSGFLDACLSASAGAQVPPASPTARFDQAIVTAEQGLRKGDGAAARKAYDLALEEGWLLIGTLDRLDGRLADARAAFQVAAASGSRAALLSLAVAHLQLGQSQEAADILTRLVSGAPEDAQAHRLLGQALLANGRTDDAVRELEEAQRLAPADIEVAFALGSAYLSQKSADRAAAAFARIVKARPLARTHLLIARTYREHGELERARGEVRAALAKEPRIKGAHYLLGMLSVQEGGRLALDAGIAEFRAELAISPGDSSARRELGVALVESQRAAEALAPLEAAARAEPPHSRTLYYLGRAQVAANRAADAVASFRRALELAQGQGANAQALRAIHLQLAQALRATGADDEAAVHFAESARQSAEGASAEEASLTRYLADAPDPSAPRAAVPVLEASPLAALPAARRTEMRRTVSAGLARAYLNLGILRMQAEEFPAAAELFERAVQLDPSASQAQGSLGIARFNARQFDRATGPLERALSASPDDRGLRRMLAMAWLNLESYAKAVALLEDDPERPSNPSLQFAYGLALVKSGRGAEAERAFQDLLTRHGDSAELSVLLGQANAQQGDFEAAVEALQRALRLKADVPEANATLGVIYLRQGRLEEAERALRAELAGRPADAVSQQHLAIVLELLQRPQEAIALLRTVLGAKPDLADARYRLGKLLLAQGDATEALSQLEAAVKLAPEDANIRYQLGRAYQRLGRTEEAERQYEEFRRIKDKPQGE